MTARVQASRVAEELARRQITVVAEEHNTTTIAALHHPRLDGPTAFLLVLSPESRTGWRVGERTGTDEYSAVPSRLDALPVDAPVSDVADAIQTYLENQLDSSDPIAAIERIRLQYNDRPLLLVLRGNTETADTVAAQWTNAFRDQFDRTLCVDADEHRVGDRDASCRHTGLVHIVDVLRQLIAQLDGVAPGLEDPAYLGYAEDLSDDTLDRHASYLNSIKDKRVVVHLHHADERAQARWIMPTTPGSVAILTSRQLLTELSLDGAHFLDV